MNKEQLLEAIKKLRENEKRKFDQSVDLIINLRNFDTRRETVNLFLNLPNKVKDVKICGFFTKKSPVIDTITKLDLEKYKDKKIIKKLVSEYDFFIASPALMPSIASTLGRYLGPSGKMPSPQMGIVKDESDAEIKAAVERFAKIIRVKSKEPSLKFCVGKESMNDEKIIENILTAYNTIVNALPRKKENVKSIKIKFTMTPAVKMEI